MNHFPGLCSTLMLWLKFKLWLSDNLPLQKRDGNWKLLLLGSLLGMYNRAISQFVFPILRNSSRSLFEGFLIVSKVVNDAKPTLCFFSADHQVFTKLITWRNLLVAMVTQQRPLYLLNCLIGALKKKKAVTMKNRMDRWRRMAAARMGVGNEYGEIPG